MSRKLEGDERYLITESDRNDVALVLHKADSKGDPDLHGAEYHIIEELGDGYMVYMRSPDPSQPNPNYFIHKKYILNQPKRD
jgi:hypothetical protein